MHPQSSTDSGGAASATKALPPCTLLPPCSDGWNWPSHPTENGDVDSTHALSISPYPGRGVAACHTERDGLGLIYWLSGRSSASRRRALVPDDRGLRVVDLDGLDDDPLRHYRVSLRDGLFEVIGNGDHVDQLALDLALGISVDAAYDALEPEPDMIGTPRVAAVVEATTGRVSIGGARPAPSGSGVERQLLGPTSIQVGMGLLIATYCGDPKSPSPWAEPLWINAANTLDDQIEEIWGSIEEDCRVSIAYRRVTLGAQWMVRT